MHHPHNVYWTPYQSGNYYPGVSPWTCCHYPYNGCCQSFCHHFSPYSGSVEFRNRAPGPWAGQQNFCPLPFNQCYPPYPNCYKDLNSNSNGELGDTFKENRTIDTESTPSQEGTQYYGRGFFPFLSQNNSYPDANFWEPRGHCCQFKSGLDELKDLRSELKKNVETIRHTGNEIKDFLLAQNPVSYPAEDLAEKFLKQRPFLSDKQRNELIEMLNYNFPEEGGDSLSKGRDRVLIRPHPVPKATTVSLDEENSRSLVDALCNEIIKRISGAGLTLGDRRDKSLASEDIGLRGANLKDMESNSSQPRKLKVVKDPSIKIVPNIQNVTTPLRIPEAEPQVLKPFPSKGESQIKIPNLQGLASSLFKEPDAGSYKPVFDEGRSRVKIPLNAENSKKPQDMARTEGLNSSSAPCNEKKALTREQKEEKLRMLVKSVAEAQNKFSILERHDFSNTLARDDWEKELRKLDFFVQNILTECDEIQSDGDSVIRQKRKEVVKMAQAVLDAIEQLPRQAPSGTGGSAQKKDGDSAAEMSSCAAGSEGSIDTSCTEKESKGHAFNQLASCASSREDLLLANEEEPRRNTEASSGKRIRLGDVEVAKTATDEVESSEGAELTGNESPSNPFSPPPDSPPELIEENLRDISNESSEKRSIESVEVQSLKGPDFEKDNEFGAKKEVGAEDLEKKPGTKCSDAERETGHGDLEKVTERGPMEGTHPQCRAESCGDQGRSTEDEYVKV
jgi:hypothetical protein